MEEIIHKSIFTHPLYLALKSANADEKLSIDAVLHNNTSRSEFATKQDLEEFKLATEKNFKEVREDIKKLSEVLRDSQTNTLKWVIGINMAFYLGVIGVIVGL